LLRRLDPGISNLPGGGSPADHAVVEQSDVDRARSCQRFPHPEPRRCGWYRDRQLPGRPWADKNIAILHDNTAFGKYIAEEAKKQLNRRDLTEAVYRDYVPGRADYGAEIDQLQAAEVAVAFIGGYHPEIGLMARLARDRGYQVQLIAGTNMGTEEFGLIAGPAAEGTIFTDHADPRRRIEAAPIVERFRASGFEPEGDTLYAYAAVQAWAQAAEQAGSLELQAMIASLRQHQFETVLGPTDFDEKGDLTVQNPAWYVWRGGTYMPLEPSP
jgi:branched-chain amino acid transport system substrate-binding protein